MDQLSKNLYALSLAGLVSVSGCNLPSSTPPVDPDAAYGYPGEIFGHRAFNALVVARMQDIARKTSDPVKLLFIDNNGDGIDNTENGSYNPIFSDCNCSYTFVNNAADADIIVRYEQGQWNESLTTSGFTPVLTRLGYHQTGPIVDHEQEVEAPFSFVPYAALETWPMSQNSWRQIELNNNWQPALKHFFPEPNANNTRFAAVGHGRQFEYAHSDLFEILAHTINDQNPDQVFLLGDFVRDSYDDEYCTLSHHFLDILNPNPGYIYVPGNHEVNNVLDDLWVPTENYMRTGEENSEPVFNRVIGEPTKLITSATENLITLNSASTLLSGVNVNGVMGVTEQLQGIRDGSIISPDGTPYNPNLPTVLLTHHRVWLWDWPFKVDFISPSYYGYDFMPLIASAGQDENQVPLVLDPIIPVDAIINGDAGSGIFRGWQWRHWAGMPTLDVGMDDKGTNSSIHFAMVTIGSDKIMRSTPIYIDLPINHPYYTDANRVWTADTHGWYRDAISGVWLEESPGSGHCSQPIPLGNAAIPYLQNNP